MGRKISLERRAEIGRMRRERTRENILRVAFELLGREEGRSTRIDEICEAAEVARGTFYNYYTSVEELFRALTFEISHDFNLAVRAVIKSVPAGAIRSAFALRYYLHRTRSDPSWGWAMVNLSVSGPIFGEETTRYGLECIEEGLITEQFTAQSAQMAYDFMHGAALAGMITLLRSEQPEDYPEQMVALIMRGLGVSSTLIDRCITPALPDPFAFIREHGAAHEAQAPDLVGADKVFNGWVKPAA
jgi:AcrR family transcriptional regulator